MRLQGSLYAAVAVLLISIGIGTYVDHQNDRMHQRHLEISTRLERMVRLSQELTGMLATAVLEGNTLRTASYDTVKTELDHTFSTVDELTRDFNLSGEMADLSEEHDKLRVVEQQAIELMRVDRWQDARRLLANDEYLMARKIYEINSETVVGALSGELAAMASQHARWRQAALALRLGAVALLLWVGGKFSRRLRKEVLEQQRLRLRISAANEALEEKVRKRTQELQAANRQLEVLSATDSLTGLANRRHFDTIWQQEWQRATRQGLPLAVIMLDVDHFKAFNDEYGHPAGDDCLRQVAKVLAGTARRAGELAARYGGEEFVVVLPNTTTQVARQTADLIRRDVQALAIAHAKSATSTVVTVSLGFSARVPALEDGLYSLLQEADDALYQAKRQGRNLVMEWAPAEDTLSL
ncbi:GGDEF domain-containing protein [Hydrogenophaga aquatica]